MAEIGFNKDQGVVKVDPEQDGDGKMKKLGVSTFAKNLFPGRIFVCPGIIVVKRRHY